MEQYFGSKIWVGIFGCKILVQRKRIGRKKWFEDLTGSVFPCPQEQKFLPYSPKNLSLVVGSSLCTMTGHPHLKHFFRILESKAIAVDGGAGEEEGLC